MKHIKLITLIVVFFTSAGFRWAGGKEMFIADVNHMQDLLNNSTGLSMRVSVGNISISGAVPQVSAEVKRKGTEVYYKLMGNEYLFTNKHTVMVDHSKKLIAYSPADPVYRNLVFSMLPSVDSVLRFFDSVSLKGSAKGEHRYMIYNKRSPIKSIEAFYNTEIGFFTKFIYEYDEEYGGDAGKIAVIYSDINFNTKFSDLEFSVSRFVSVKGDQIMGVGALSKYSVTKVPIQN